MSRGKADELRNPRAAARPSQMRWLDKASQRDLATDRIAELSAGQTHPPRARLRIHARAIAGGQAACVVLDAPHRGLVDILRRFLDRLIHDAMEATPVLLASVFAANQIALLRRRFNHVRSPCTQATTNQHTRQRWLS